MKKKHVLLQGFGSFPLNFKALIEHARATGDASIEWSIVCTTGHYVETFEKLLGKEAVLYLHSDIKNYLGAPGLLDRLSDHSGNIYRNIESEKRFTKHKKSMRQLRSAAAMYLSMKTFMQNRRPTHILFGQIEGMDGMTLISLGRELGIPALVPTHTRHLGETFFSPDHLETLPPDIVANDTHRARAAAFLQKFRNGETSASSVPPEITQGPGETHPFIQPPFFRRAIGVLRRLINEPEMREPDVFRASLFINFPALANLFWKTRGAINKRIYDISTLDQLPKYFAYYPLQYSPESSINTPDPYFVDQLRAIDAIRFALPSDMMLVVKEHPTCVELRPLGFLNALQKKAGVVLARYDMPSGRIIDRADITFSVSGTAALEAFLKGKPSLTLGHGFFSAFLGGATGVDSLPRRIQEALDNPPPDQKIIDSIACVYAASAPFVLGSPFDGGSPFSKYALGNANIDYFYRHLRREIDDA
jgi:hypothetical protein